MRLEEHAISTGLTLWSELSILILPVNAIWTTFAGIVLVALMFMQLAHLHISLANGNPTRMHGT